jgi:predicted DNA-binding transcriptional regulator YafY
MLETSARLLRLLSLLQSRRDWTGAELAAQLEVTPRTVRNDVDRLRELGYPVEARPGVGGGYRLGVGGSLPPLLLHDEEAVAVAIGLRTVATAAIAGIGETSVGALAKLQQVLPSRLRHRLRAFEASTLALPTHGPTVDPDTLTLIAGTCRDHEVLRFNYAAHSGAESRRRVEPYRLVNDRRRWYLLAWDLEREDWRTFRADRIRPITPAGPKFTPRPLPPDDMLADQMARRIGEATWRYRARIVVHASAETVRAKIPIPIEVQRLGENRCEFQPGSDDPQQLALHLGMLGVDFEVIDAPELADALRFLAARFERAAGA